MSKTDILKSGFQKQIEFDTLALMTTGKLVLTHFHQWMASMDMAGILEEAGNI